MRGFRHSLNIFVMALFALCLTGVLDGSTAQAANAQFRRAVPSASSKADIGARIDFVRATALSSTALQDILKELFRTASGTYQNGCFSGAFVCSAGTGFDVVVAPGYCFYQNATGATADVSSYRVLQETASTQVTDWEANPGAATYYVHVTPGDSRDTDGYVIPDPVYTVDTNASLAGAYTPCSIVVGGAEPDATTYTYNDLRAQLGLAYVGGEHIDATGDEIDAVADLSAVGVLPRVCSVTVDSAGERTAGAHAICTLPAKAIVTDVYMSITAEETSGTTNVDIGPAGTAAGYADDLSVAAADFVRPQAATTAGGSETYFSSNTRGSLLAVFLAGSDSATDVGTYVEHPTTTGSGLVVNYTVPAGGWTEMTGTVYIMYYEVE